MAIKWIAMDMDGTLLDRNDKIMPLTKECLMKCQKKGIKLILASGRSWSRLMPYVKELEMDQYQGSLIEVNGMAVTNLESGKRTVFAQMNKTDLDELFPFFQALEVEIQCYQDQSIYFWIPQSHIPMKEQERKKRGVPKDYPWNAGAWNWVTDNRNGYPVQKWIQSPDEVPEEFNKIVCGGAPEHMEKVFPIIKEKYGDQYELTRTCPRMVEICPKGITKGQTLKRCMEQEGILPDEVMVFGDGENDADMFHQVKYSIAMGNAEEFVKELASEVTDTNYQEGIAKAILRHIDLEMEHAEH